MPTVIGSSRFLAGTKEQRQKWIARTLDAYGHSKWVSIEDVWIAAQCDTKLLISIRPNQNKSICSFLAGTDRPYPESAEPINLISRNFPPTCVVSATEDGLIPTEQFGRLYDRVKELGIDALLVECQGMRHAEAEKLPLSPEWPEGNSWWKDALLPSLVFALQRMTEDQ